MKVGASDQPILTVEEMGKAEQKAIAAGTSVEMLMERAGAAVVEAIRRYASPTRALVLCGPGNNGGDGYVIARLLEERGVPTEVAALGEPQSEAAIAARARWDGPVVPLAEAEAAPVLVDALFGTGLKRGLDDGAAQHFLNLARQAKIRVAVDLPSGVVTDDGCILSPVPDFDLTVTFGALKPAHLLQPAARHMGRLIVADIGIETESALHLVGQPYIISPGPDDHKYSRGYVAVVAGDMAGASALAASAAARAGAGYVRLVADTHVPGVPLAIIQNPGDRGDLLVDPRIGAVAIGPGLGRGKEAKRILAKALALDHPLILDADALWLLDGPEACLGVKLTPILTPHAGEFTHLFGDIAGSKIEQVRQAAKQSGAVILLKGSDTIIAAPDGRAVIAPPAPHWLASAGAGDVLTGIIAAMRAQGMGAFEAASAGAWLHMRAAELAGPLLIADDLLHPLRQAVAECL
jgi:hydroxyethylthiazole kinase-like uncharacterized protein yjeF